jgi:hypothetical protein
VTIDVLKRLTAESLEIFGQVSHRWYKFLGCGISLSLLLSPSGEKVKPIPRQDREVKEGHPPRKRAKITSLEVLQAGKLQAGKNKEEEEEEEKGPSGKLRLNRARSWQYCQQVAVRA